jgi:hypothetical protein
MKAKEVSAVLLVLAISSVECKAPPSQGRQRILALAFSPSLPSKSSSRQADFFQISTTPPDGRTWMHNLRPPFRPFEISHGKGLKSNPLALNLFSRRFSTDESGDDGTTPEAHNVVNGNKGLKDTKGSVTTRGTRVKNLAKKLLAKPLQVVPMPQAIAAVLRDATYAAVEEVEVKLVGGRWSEPNARVDALKSTKELVTNLVEDAFAPLELRLQELEESLVKARTAVELAKLDSIDAIEAIQVAAIAQAEGAAKAVAQAEKVAELQVMKDIYSNAVSTADVSGLSFEDLDFESSEMAPPFLDPDSCLIPGEPVIRVEKAPENSRRIFAGIDIMASVDDVWNVSFFAGGG